MASHSPSTTLQSDAASKTLSISNRPQKTIATQASITGIGLFTNSDVTVRFLPAEANTGIVFRRTNSGQQNDEAISIPARIEYLVDTPRHTSLTHKGCSIEMIEHTLAALAGLEIDNCIVEVDGPELPGLDGSSAPTVNALLQAGLVEQAASTCRKPILEAFEVRDEQGGVISAEPSPDCNTLEITYLLDHPKPIIGRQSASLQVTPEAFVDEIAPARTFVLSNEVDALLAAGYGQRLTHRDLCVFDDNGLIDNVIRYTNEPARHKLLDCIGDFALAGLSISGRVIASKSGHALNHRFVRELLERQAIEPTTRRRAA